MGDPIKESLKTHFEVTFKSLTFCTIVPDSPSRIPLWGDGEVEQDVSWRPIADLDSDLGCFNVTWRYILKPPPMAISFTICIIITTSSFSSQRQEDGS